MRFCLGNPQRILQGKFVHITCPSAHNSNLSLSRLAVRDSTSAFLSTTGIAPPLDQGSSSSSLGGTAQSITSTVTLPSLSTAATSVPVTSSAPSLLSSATGLPSLITLTATAVATVDGGGSDISGNGLFSAATLTVGSAQVTSAAFTSSNNPISVSMDGSSSVLTGAFSTAQAAPSASTTYQVEVGANGQDIFEPNNVNAPVGSVISFTFRGLNHTLTESSLEQPCLSAQQFDSGFTMYNAANTEDMKLSFTVNSPGPRWFFCAQTDDVNHCHEGMVFAINPGLDLDTFIANAVGGATTTPSAVSSPTSTISGVSAPTQTLLTSSTAASASTLRASTTALTIATTASSLLLSSSALSVLSS